MEGGMGGAESFGTDGRNSPERSVSLGRIEENFVLLMGRAAYEDAVREPDRIKELLWSDEQNRRCLALHLIAKERTRDKSVIDKLVGLARSDASEFVRRTALLALSSVRLTTEYSRVSEVLIEICLSGEENELVRKTAYYSLTLFNDGTGGAARVPRAKRFHIWNSAVTDFDEAYLRCVRARFSMVSGDTMTSGDRGSGPGRPG
jgi:hypothetical protein